MSKQLAFDDPLGDGAAVDRDHRLGTPLPQCMNGLGNDFLADAAFPCDQDSDVCGSHLLDGLDDLLHNDGLADNPMHGNRGSRVRF